MTNTAINRELTSNRSNYGVGRDAGAQFAGLGAAAQIQSPGPLDSSPRDAIESALLELANPAFEGPAGPSITTRNSP